ncbi:hypothetical protein G6F50_016229 [Rhizopus delemar]|uniref:Uncharacterized protein n=1 Tax=Rhizopus delemar TaxID=936053 RepID=A0A9P6XU15_9FUNG|nr:hypothetical protein G6F50_016229 [Rhizopus delemar]
MGILGSTGSYAYLEKAERKRVLRQALAHAGGVPVIVGVGALRTRDVLEMARDAEDAGAAGLLLALVEVAMFDYLGRIVDMVAEQPGADFFTRHANELGWMLA